MWTITLLSTALRGRTNAPSRCHVVGDAPNLSDTETGRSPSHGLTRSPNATPTRNPRMPCVQCVTCTGSHGAALSAVNSRTKSSSRSSCFRLDQKAQPLSETLCMVTAMTADFLAGSSVTSNCIPSENRSLPRLPVYESGSPPASAVETSRRTSSVFTDDVLEDACPFTFLFSLALVSDSIDWHVLRLNDSQVAAMRLTCRAFLTWQPAGHLHPSARRTVYFMAASENRKSTAIQSVPLIVLSRFRRKSRVVLPGIVRSILRNESGCHPSGRRFPS